MNFLTVNLILSALVFWLAARIVTHYLNFVVLIRRPDMKLSPDAGMLR
jgi:hypothetical protein